MTESPMQRLPLISPARSTTDCLPASVLRAVAAGEVQDPLLGVYLAHVESCDACCARLDDETGRQRRGDPGDEAGGPPPAAGFPADRITADRFPADGFSDARLGPWLEQLKQTTAVDSAAEDLRVGARIGPFRVTASLGEGASAVVFEAVDENLDRPVVLKVLRPAHDDCPEQHRLLVSEARALAALHHDAIMPLLQILWHEGSPVLVFPRLPGETLADALASGRCTPRMTLAIVRDVASALAHTHEQGIFHHDIKPSNIWLWRCGTGKQDSALLFDFGLTGSTTVAAGTPGYADPELTAASDPKSRDLFSLGVVLFECLAASGAVPAGYRDLVRRLTAAEPMARPAAAEVVDQLDRLLARPRRLTWAAVFAGICAVGVLAAVSLGSIRPSGPPTAGQVARSGPIQPDLVITSAGFPLALSRDAQTLCAVVDGPGLRFRPLDDPAGGKTVPLAFKPDRLAFNEKGDRLAAADVAGNVAILDVPSATVTATHQFEGGVAWLGWAGWKRDVVIVQSGEEVHAFYKTRKGEPDASIPEWHLEFLRGNVQALATLPGTEGVISMNHDGRLLMWSAGRFTEDMPLPMLDVIRYPRAGAIGWKSPGVCFVVEGRKVCEFAPYHGVRSFKAPAPVDSLVWLTDGRYVFTTAGSAERPRLLVGDTARPGWSEALDLGGETPVKLALLDDQRVAAITSDGDVRIYSTRFQP